jgi:peptidoglycan/xylan/chitin deacetylase (PgdA/CDA1 family)
MRPRRDPVPRARDAWSWLFGTALLGILGAGVVAAAVTLWENVDVRPLAPQLAVVPPLPVPEPPAPVARADVPFAAVVFDSPASRAYFPDSTYHRRALEAWEDLIGASGGSVRAVSTAAELRALDHTDVLVLAETPCVSDGELAAVRAHVRRSGSVVASWAVGARDGSCGWRGWDFVTELTRAEHVREIPSRPGLFLTVPAGVALSSGLAPGTRIELRPDPSLAIRLEGARVYWSDWALNPRPDETGAGADAAAVAIHSDAGGRIAWLGMRLGQAATPMDSLRLRRLAQNGVLWAAGVPVAAPGAWPGGHAAALVVSLDVEDEAHHALATAEMLSEREIPGTFFVVSQLVQGDSALATALGRAGEVGSQTADHTPVAGLTPQDQRVRLRRSWAEVESWTGRGPRGLHPPEERFDAATLAAWAAAGGTYLLATNEARSASPELHRVGAGEAVVLPRLLKDDYNIIVQDRVIRAKGLAEAWLAGLRKTHAIGGLAVIASHTQIMRPGARIDALASVLDSARLVGDWWIAPGGGVAEWWGARDGVRLSFASRGESSAPAGGGTWVEELLVEAPPLRPVADLWIDIVLPDAPAATFPLVDGTPVGFVETAWGMRVPVGDLPPGGVRRVSLMAAPADGDLPWT